MIELYWEKVHHSTGYYINGYYLGEDYAVIRVSNIDRIAFQVKGFDQADLDSGKWKFSNLSLEDTKKMCCLMLDALKRLDRGLLQV